jgi:hypothetical protein
VIVTQCRIQYLPRYSRLRRTRNHLWYSTHIIILVSLEGKEMLQLLPVLLGEKGRGTNTAVAVARLPTLEIL